MIVLKNVNKSFDKKIVLNNINLEIPDNKIVGLFGLNGSGKTTLLRMMSRVYNAENETIFFDNVEIKKAKDEVFFISEENRFSNNASVSSLLDNYKYFYKNFDVIYFEELIDRFELNLKDKIISYSKGMKKKVLLCLGLASNAKYLFIDEAFDGVDDYSKKIFKELFFKYLEKNEKSTIIISSHSFVDLEDFIDKVIFMRKGDLLINDDYNSLIDKYIKLQLAYEKEIDINILKSLNPLMIKQNGKFYDLIISSKDDVVEKINETNPSFINQTKILFNELIETVLKEEK